MTETEPKRYLVCGCTPWAADVFAQTLNKLPGEWHYTEDQPGLVMAKPGRYRYVFFLHWRWRVPADVLADNECVGFHLGRLPEERGGTPAQWRILAPSQVPEDEEDGPGATLTAFRMTEEVDAGPVYATALVGLDGPAERIYHEAMGEAAQFIRWITEEEPEPYTQVGEPTVYARRRPEDSDLSRAAPPGTTLGRVYDLIRCVDAPDYPLAYLEVNGLRYAFRRAVWYGGRVEADVTITRAAPEEPDGPAWTGEADA